MNLIGVTTVVPQATGGHTDVTLRHGDGLTVVQRLDGGKRVDVLLEEVRKVVEKLSSVLWGNLPPLALESLTSSSDGNIYIFLGCLVDGSDDLFGGGVDGLKSLAINTLDELVVDEAVQGQTR